MSRAAQDPRQVPALGYPVEEPVPERAPLKAPGEGDPAEPRNDPDQKPGRGNG